MRGCGGLSLEGPESVTLAYPNAALALFHSISRLAQQHGQRSGNGLAQLAAVADEVDGAFFLQEFGALKALGQYYSHRSLDHPRAGKADQRLGLGHNDVAHEGKAGADSAHGRVGEHADIGQAFFGQTGQG